MKARSPLALGALLVIVASAAPAFAQPTPETRAAATALFDDARKAMTARDYATACPKLEAAQRMDPGIGILLNLADCYEHIGKTASAWSSFRDVAAEAANKGQADREKLARERAAALEPKLTRLKVVVPPEVAVPGLEVTRDGVVVPAAILGTPVPVDPGKHVVAAKAPGKKPFHVEVVADQPGGVATVTVAALEAGPIEAAPVAGAAGQPTPPGNEPAPATSTPSSWQKPAGIVVGSVGLAGIGVGAVLGLVAKSKLDQSNTTNPCDKNDLCDQRGVDLRSSAGSFGNVSTVMFIAGGVLTAGGVVLWLTAPSAPAQVGLTPTGATLRGSF